MLCCTGAQIRRIDISPFEMRDAFDDGTAAFYADFGSHALEFIDMHKAVFKCRFRNDTCSLANSRKCHELGLHIRRKSRIRQCLDIGRPQRFMANGATA